MSTCPAARPRPRASSTGSCSCRRRSAAPGPSSVADALEALIRSVLPGDAPVRYGRNHRGHELRLAVTREGLLPLMLTLRDTPALDFALLMDICGVDWPDRPERFEVVYNLLSVTANQRVTVVVTTDGEQPVPTVAPLWPSATWYEREAWDMYGIVFAGQPDLRRLLTDYGFEGHPLRKDFPLTGFVEVRYDEVEKRVVREPVKLQQDFREFDFLSPWEAMTTLPGDEKVHLNRLADEAPGRIEAPKP
ncbi:MAG: NADH-quinone oxidoreductase subunit C [Acetobacteraceae bacterium]|nr:NADH-quinone oxidoreductase subunit C [Acetobacteraceae bacterium]